MRVFPESGVVNESVSFFCVNRKYHEEAEVVTAFSYSFND